MTLLVRTYRINGQREVQTHRDIIEKGKKLEIVANMWRILCEYLQDYISWYKPKLIHFDIKEPKITILLFMLYLDLITLGYERKMRY